MGKYDRQKKWKAAHKYAFKFDLYENNSDMAAWLLNKESVAGYLKDLIRADMDAHQAEVADAVAKYNAAIDEQEDAAD